MKSPKNIKTQIYLTGLALLTICAIYYSNISDYNYESLKVLGGFALIQLIFILYSWKRLTGSIFDAYIIFIGTCYAFSLTQPILELFNGVSPVRSIITHYNYPFDIYCQATFVSYYFILFFHIGAVASYKKSIFGARPISSDIYEIDQKCIYKVAFYFALLSFPGYMYNTIVNMVISATEGYGAIYAEDSGRLKILGLIGDYYVPAIICMYFASAALNRKKKQTMFIIFITVFIPPLIIGGRSNAIIILAILFLIYTFFHKVNKKVLLYAGVGIYIIFTAFAVIAGNRGGGAAAYKSIKLNDEEKGNPVLFTLSEMGGSLQPLMNTMHIIPDQQNFRYGQSYLYATTTIIPNVGIWKIHPATKYSNLGKWLKEYLNLPYGPGFSIVAEAYYNFGYFGFIIMFIFGFAFARILSNASRSNLYVNPIKTVMSLVFLWLTIKLARNSFEFAVRAFVYYYFPMYWLMKYVAKKQYKHIRYRNRNITSDFSKIVISKQLQLQD